MVGAPEKLAGIRQFCLHPAPFYVLSFAPNRCALVGSRVSPRDTSSANGRVRTPRLFARVPHDASKFPGAVGLALQDPKEATAQRLHFPALRLAVGTREVAPFIGLTVEHLHVFE